MQLTDKTKQILTCLFLLCFAFISHVSALTLDVLKPIEQAQIEFDNGNYTKAIELDPKMADAYNNRGNCKLNLRRMQEACEDWRISLNMGNKNSVDMLNNYCK